jgi:hypothetical protein
LVITGGLDVVQAAVEHWPLLETLRLRVVPLNVRAAHVLGSASRLSRLRKLDLTGNKFGSQGLAALLGGAAWLDTVEELDLCGTFDDHNLPPWEVKKAVQALIDAAPTLPSLTSLALREFSGFVPLDKEWMSELNFAFPRVWIRTEEEED